MIYPWFFFLAAAGTLLLPAGMGTGLTCLFLPCPTGPSPP